MQCAPRETGSAAGLLNAVLQLGATIGVAALGSVFLNRAGAHFAYAGRAAQDAFAAGGLALVLLTAPVCG